MSHRRAFNAVRIRALAADTPQPWSERVFRWARLAPAGAAMVLMLVAAVRGEPQPARPARRAERSPGRDPRSAPTPVTLTPHEEAWWIQYQPTPEIRLPATGVMASFDPNPGAIHSRCRGRHHGFIRSDPKGTAKPRTPRDRFRCSSSARSCWPDAGRTRRGSGASVRGWDVTGADLAERLDRHRVAGLDADRGAARTRAGQAVPRGRSAGVHRRRAIQHVLRAAQRWRGAGHVPQHPVRLRPTQLYACAVRLEWKQGGNAIYTRAGHFFPSPAIVQPGHTAVYPVMAGQQVTGAGTPATW